MWSDAREGKEEVPESWMSYAEGIYLLDQGEQRSRQHNISA